jgi:hypothetical protein
MSENTAETATATDTDAKAQGNPGTEALGDAGKQALDRMKAERDEQKRLARAAQTELEKLRNATQTEQEKALHAARTEGAQEAAKKYGTRLVRTEFDAAAGRRNPDFDTAAALEYVDLAKFVGEDGEPDTKAIKAAVERLVPAAAGGPASVDGGARTTAVTGNDMNQLIRKAAGRA